MALGVLILSAVPGYQPELLSYLFGSLLTVSRERLAAVALITVVVVGVLVRWRHRLVFAVFDADGAQVAGIRVARLLMLYHVLLALTVIASLSTVGIVLANALLVIPAATAKLLARSLAQMFWLAPLVGIGSVLVGLALAYRLDWPSGPAIVVVAGLAFLTAWGARTWRATRSTRR
jgi:ABC-type Mn2+/Zn2+ transport system permease subunit